MFLSDLFTCILCNHGICNFPLPLGSLLWHAQENNRWIDGNQLWIFKHVWAGMKSYSILNLWFNHSSSIVFIRCVLHLEEMASFKIQLQLQSNNCTATASIQLQFFQQNIYSLHIIDNVHIFVTNCQAGLISLTSGHQSCSLWCITMLYVALCCYVNCKIWDLRYYEMETFCTSVIK